MPTFVIRNRTKPRLVVKRGVCGLNLADLANLMCSLRRLLLLLLRLALLKLAHGSRFKRSSVTILSFRIDASPAHRSCTIWSRAAVCLAPVSFVLPVMFYSFSRFSPVQQHVLPPGQLLNECPFDGPFAG